MPCVTEPTPAAGAAAGRYACVRKFHRRHADNEAVVRALGSLVNRAAGLVHTLGPKSLRSAAALGRARELFRLAQENRLLLSRPGEGLCEVDTAGTMSFVNPAAAAMLGWEAEELIGQSAHALLHQGRPGDTGHPREACPLGTTLRDGTTQRVDDEAFWCKDGTSFPVEYVCSPIHEDGRVAGALLTFRDATVARMDGDTLRQSHALLEIITRAQSRLLAAVDPRVIFDDLLGGLLGLTTSPYGFLGEVLFTPAGAPYLKPHAITNGACAPAEEHLWASLDFNDLRTRFGDALLTGAPVVSDEPAPAFNGNVPPDEPRLESLLVLPLHSGARVVGLVGLANRPAGYDARLVALLQPVVPACTTLIEACRRDERRRGAEQALADARDQALAQTRRKSEFLAHLSHELRTPLSGVMGMIELTLDTELTAGQREHLDTARAAAGDLVRVLDDVGDLLSIEVGGLRVEAVPFGLRDHLRLTLKPLVLRARQKGITLTSRVAPEVPDRVLGDPGHLGQILLNLVGNAIRFTSAGTVRAAIDVEPGDGACLHFSVADTGIGIPDEERARLTEVLTHADAPTARLSHGGLGLVICAWLVRHLGGRIWVESEVGRGSTFHFTVRCALPAGDAAVPVGPADEPAAGGGRAREPLRVLLAEDDAVNRMATVRLLERSGHTVVPVENGREALAALEHERFDVVLMDVEMEEMDGLQAAATIRARERATGGRVPLVALTGHALAGDAERSRAAGMDAYLVKPIQTAELLATLARVTAEATVLRSDTSAPRARPGPPVKGPRHDLPPQDAAALREGPHRLPDALAALAREPASRRKAKGRRPRAEGPARRT